MASERCVQMQWSRTCSHGSTRQKLQNNIVLKFARRKIFEKLNLNVKKQNRSKLDATQCDVDYLLHTNSEI